MIWLEKWMILTPLQKLQNNVGNLGKIFVATGFEWLPKKQNIAQSGHTDYPLLGYGVCVDGDVSVTRLGHFLWHIFTQK